jgi:isopentenyl diphosphate isomerase/L-lactate dehydrogenase-like FMN-dependent dehydrogenase
MPEPPEIVTIEDFERLARERLPAETWEYYAGGSADEWTLLENRRAFERWVIRPRMLVTARERDLSIELLGERASLPVLVAPWAYQRLADPDGEVATARAVARAGTIMAVSTTAVAFAREIAAASEAPKWWQLYVFADRAATADMLERVVALGYRAIVVTTDFQEGGLRYGLIRSGWEPPLELGYTDLAFDPAISWDDLGWVREHAPVPLILKGILTAEDARLAVDAGVDAIVVSNHGGRQLDHTPASISVLPEIVEAVEGRVPVLLDGGVRHGGDVFVCLALGAAAVLVGRPAVWGLAARGEDGVVEVLDLLRAELENVMALAGCNRIADISRAHVAPAG